MVYNDKTSNEINAITKYKVIQQSKNYALVLLYPETGKKHQLRLHCSDYLFSPIVGDRKYGGIIKNLKIPKDDTIPSFLPVNRNPLFLHCLRIEIPNYDKKISIFSKPPNYYSQFSLFGLNSCKFENLK